MSNPHIPFDIQVLIIQRLPFKSVIRFRLVCKAWKSFIDFESRLLIIQRLPVKSLIPFRFVCKAWKSHIDSPEFIAFIASYGFCHI
ncbi:hypothetical protein OSB04_028823 [Centaurea solstitialis]|uniref:F-box domain-containing protein n=1 Tax=Centaurea solstitialis TaxID=347529 RepID=A0AA38VY61_9ASTR|nr:hypothetical protein OSB04_028823 [Centaurea solstitialis]